MVYRIYVEKKQGFDHEAAALVREATDILEIGGIEKIRVFNRYDVEGLDRALFEKAVNTVLNQGYRTGDIMSEGKTLVSCSQMGSLIADLI